MLMDYSVQSSIILYFKRCVCVCVIWCMYVWCHETWGSVIAFYLVSDREQILVFLAINARLAGTLASRDSLVSLPPILPALLLQTHATVTGHWVCSGESNSGPHISVAAIVSTEQSLHPYCLLFYPFYLATTWHRKVFQDNFALFFVLFRICSSYLKIIFQALSIYKLI